jgi:hypothetical protein
VHLYGTKNYNMQCFRKKVLQSTTILGEFQRDLFPLLYCMVMDVVFGDFIFT